MERHRVGIVIPALNEAATIGPVVANAARYGMPIVVDDGSSDGVGDVARLAGAIVVRHESNRGYDEALNSGMARAEEIDCAYILTMDADGQHDPTTLETFIRALDDGADVVVGIRDRRQRFGEQAFAWVGRAWWGIADPLCGMKAYRIGVYRELGHFDCYMSIGSELAIHAARSGKRIAQVTVTTADRDGHARFGRRFSANHRILRALWRSLFRRH